METECERYDLEMDEIALWSGAVLPFVDRLSRCERFARILTGANSFEGWLKWELIDELARRYAWTSRDGRLDPERIGVEWKAPLHEVARPYYKKLQKQIDVYVCTNPDGARYHGVEIKIIFDNKNLTKQACSAGSDLWYLASMLPAEGGKPASIATLAFFVAEDDGERPEDDPVDRTIREWCQPIVPTVATVRRLGRGRCWAYYYEANWSDAHKSVIAGQPPDPVEAGPGIE